MDRAEDGYLASWFSRFLADKRVDASLRDTIIHGLTSTLRPARQDDNLWENAVVKRRLALQHIYQRFVRILFLKPDLNRYRYIIQTRYGCTNSQCTTLHCFSRQKRTQSAPVRPPTVLTARMIASVLATQEDPTRHLCPSPLPFPPDALKFPQYSVVGRDLIPTNTWNTETTSEKLKSGHLVAQDYWRKALRPDKKDRRSLIQNIFDSSPLRLFERTIYRTPLETFTSLFPTKRTQGARHEAGAPSQMAVPALVKEPIQPHQMATSDHVDWLYKDPNGIAQGPFTGMQMHEWYKAGFFTLELLIKTLKDPEYEPLGQRIRRVGNSCEPFLAPQPSNPRDRRPDERDSSGSVSGNLPSSHPQSHDQTIGPQTPPSTEAATENMAPKKQSSQVNGRLQFTEEEGSSKEDSPSANQHPQPSGPSDIMASTTTQSQPPRRADPDLRMWPSDQEFRLLLSFSREDGITRVKLNLPVSIPLSVHAMYGLRSMMEFCSASMDVLYYQNDDQRQSNALSTIHADTEMKYRITVYARRTLYANLSSISNLNRSFPEIGTKQDDNDYGVANFKDLLEAFRGWRPLVGPLIFDALWEALEPLFNPPDELAQAQQQPSGPGSRPMPSKYVPDSEAQTVVTVCLIALIASITHGFPGARYETVRSRVYGQLYADAGPNSDHSTHLQIADEFEYEPANRLMERLVRVIAARRCHFALLNQDTILEKVNREVKYPLMLTLIRHLIVMNEGHGNIKPSTDKELDWVSFSPACVFLHWLQTVVIHSWNGETIVDRWEPCGAAWEIMGDLFQFRDALRFHRTRFMIPYITESLDPRLLAPEYLKGHVKGARSTFNRLNLYHFTFLFHNPFVFAIFKLVNFHRLTQAYGEASFNQMFIDRLMFFQDPAKVGFVQTRLKPALSKYLILDVRRENLLEDAFDQLWGRELRELLRPLKVRIGGQEGEGEEGVDHGGVSQEFFRLVWAKAFDPDVGLFVIDEKTRMCWFQPKSTECAQTYELLGLLVGLAVYNGVTLPVTFPLALYRFLLGEICTTTAHIRDGWPELAKSFDDLLNWKDGDVKDVFSLDYVYTYMSEGEVCTLDMTRREFEPYYDQGKIAPVTNTNRHLFVRDYIMCLTHYAVPYSLHAFAKGFHTIHPPPRDWLARILIIDNMGYSSELWHLPKAPYSVGPSPLSLLSPELLQAITEGYPDFSIEDLRRITRYEDGYRSDHPLIQAFWRIVGTYDITQRRKLLEFVTASDRVPVGGIASVTFVILRAGGDSERIPSSMTCYGRLMIPEYDVSDGGKKLERKLKTALENAVGFGHV